jgi:hypothetical protein
LFLLHKRNNDRGKNDSVALSLIRQHTNLGLHTTEAQFQVILQPMLNSHRAARQVLYSECEAVSAYVIAPAMVAVETDSLQRQ